MRSTHHFQSHRLRHSRRVKAAVRHPTSVSHRCRTIAALKLRIRSITALFWRMNLSPLTTISAGWSHRFPSQTNHRKPITDTHLCEAYRQHASKRWLSVTSGNNLSPPEVHHPQPEKVKRERIGRRITDIPPAVRNVQRRNRVSPVRRHSIKAFRGGRKLLKRPIARSKSQTV